MKLKLEKPQNTSLFSQEMAKERIKKDIDLNIEKLQNELKFINKGELNGII